MTVTNFPKTIDKLIFMVYNIIKIKEREIHIMTQMEQLIKESLNKGQDVSIIDDIWIIEPCFCTNNKLWATKYEPFATMYTEEEIYAMPVVKTIIYEEENILEIYTTED